MQHKEILGGQDLDTWTTVKYIGSPANDELVEWCYHTFGDEAQLEWLLLRWL
jgi:hypothetical protein